MSDNDFVSMFKLIKQVKSEIEETVAGTKKEYTEIQGSVTNLADQVKDASQDIVKSLKKKK